ncbi:MAG: 2-dehydro-3-deoxy-6-phosphogalactonate aldolase [Novosphingobium sp.]|nr:2-dehydro-3-deoxy-6-phosphogalactonate aldolase [Novosphingobium sp.]
MKAAFSQAMQQLPLVAILRGIQADEVEPIGEVLAASGFRIIEVPLTSPDAFESIARLVRLLPHDVIVGAGTVRRREQLDRLVDAGGRLMVTPHADAALIEVAVAAGLATLPGVATPTEAFCALDAGADGLKLFPSSSIPPATVAAFRTVVGKDVDLCPTGGVEPEDFASYVKAGASGFGLGGGLYRPGHGPAEVAAKARAYVDSWRALHG